MKTETRYKPGVAILVGGGIAATCDIIYAVLRNAGAGREGLWTLQSVASGWYGNQAFEMGTQGGLIGIVSHYAILFVAAAFYLLASQRFAVLRRKPWIFGALFGVLVYLFMNFIVIPASAFPFHLKYPPLRLLEGFASHAVFVGLPIALAIRKWTQPILRA